MTALVRPADPADAESLLALVDALADYEKLPRPEAAARSRIVEDAFGARHGHVRIVDGALGILPAPGFRRTRRQRDGAEQE